MYSHGMDTRELLIESTRELLWERGYVGTSPEAIQQRAGAGQGTDHHFDGKHDLALAAIERNAGDLVVRRGGVQRPRQRPWSGSPPTCAASARC